jgi:hypothetical protein
MEPERKTNVPIHAGIDNGGGEITGNIFIGSSCVGRVDADGTVYEGTSSWNEVRVGRVDTDGTV